MRMVWALALVCCCSGLTAAEGWQDVLREMPLAKRVTQLDRSNCVEVMLRSFRSNSVVKGLIFMPGATDEFYMFRRAHASLTSEHATLLDAVCALTNQTLIRATFHSPFLLLHTAEDPLESLAEIKHARTVEKLKGRHFVAQIVSNDRDWDALQPIVRDRLKADIRPWRYSRDSWHFYRHSFAACNLDGWETLVALSLAGKSRFTVSRGRVTFQPDLRVCANVRF